MPIQRHLKNVVHNYTDAERKVREATSNDPWGPSSTLMSEIADKTHNVMAFSEIMQMIWRRLNDKSKNWRHVYKSLVLLEYIVKTGSDKVAAQCRDNIHTIETLHDFEFMEDGKDHGQNVRTKARLLSSLLRDEDRLNEERTVAMATRDRLLRSGSSFTSSSGTLPVFGASTLHSQPSHVSESSLSQRNTSHSMRSNRQSELDSVQPQSEGEENLQLQLALAISKEEHDREEKQRRAEDAKLQLALEQSRRDEHQQIQQQFASTSSTSNVASSSQLQGGGLFSLVDTSLSAAPADLPDPWSTTTPVATNPIGNMPKPTTTTSTTNAAPFSVDPWRGVDQTANKLPVAEPLFPTQSIPINTPRTNAFPTTTTALPTTNGSATNGSTTNDQTDNNSANRRRTPADFLGEHRDLVNLDKLIEKNPASTNPFAVGLPPSSLNCSSTNPFLANQPIKPSLNQLAPITGPKSVYSPPQPIVSLPAPIKNGPIGYYYTPTPHADPWVVTQPPIINSPPNNHQTSLNPFN